MRRRGLPAHAEPLGPVVPLSARPGARHRLRRGGRRLVVADPPGRGAHRAAQRVLGAGGQYGVPGREAAAARRARRHDPDRRGVRVVGGLHRAVRAAAGLAGLPASGAAACEEDGGPGAARVVPGDGPLPRRGLHRVAVLAGRGVRGAGHRRLTGQRRRQRVLLHHHHHRRHGQSARHQHGRVADCGGLARSGPARRELPGGAAPDGAHHAAGLPRAVRLRPADPGRVRGGLRGRGRAAAALVRGGRCAAGGHRGVLRRAAGAEPHLGAGVSPGAVVRAGAGADVAAAAADGAGGGGRRGDLQPGGDRLDRVGEAVPGGHGAARGPGFRCRFGSGADSASARPSPAAGARHRARRRSGGSGGGRRPSRQASPWRAGRPLRHPLGAAIGAGRGHAGAGGSHGLRPPGAPSRRALRPAARSAPSIRTVRTRRARRFCPARRAAGTARCGQGAGDERRARPVERCWPPVSASTGCRCSAWTPADLDRMGGLELVSVLPEPTLLGAALLVAVFAGALALGRQRRALLTVALLATVVSLHAVPAVLEAHPRFPTAWQHLGFLDYIGRTGDAVPDLDARWSWPGFFAGAAFLAEACGVRDFSALLRWWPTVIQLLYLAPLMVLLRALRASWRAKWTAVWLFALSGWVGQDYFSPQGFTYLFYLVFVAVLLVWFREPRVLGGKRRPGEAEVAEATRGQRAALLGLLIALFAASVAAHQLTPFVMLGVVTALVLVRRSDLYGLPLLCGVMVVVWIGFLAEPYWSGHWDELFGGVGGVGGNVSSSVSGRIEGGSSVHKLVLYVRVALAGGVLACACWGVLRRRAAGFTERALLVLTFVPFLGFGMQSYGGEMALRVFMFALPGACVLGALAIFPRVRPDRRGLAPLAALVAGLTLMSGFLVARWGNEAFERVRPGEVAAMEYVYAHDKPTVRVLWMSDDPVNNVTPAMPWGARDMERVAYEPTLAPRDPVLVSGLVTALRDAGPRSYLMVGRGQSVSLQLDGGYGARWQERLLRSLDQRTELRRVLSNDDASLYELASPPRGAVPEPKPGPAGPQITWTPWSVTGALAAVVLMVLLAAREVVRVAVRPSVRRLRWLQASYWFALPLLLVVLGSLVQRFLTMV
ncbi:conserved hypothetical protein [Streptomyces himastatinicus ATCC 53653]|uniref:Uncharacterized protein n=1 Tax=Streptomyces himastatinicus ATCC 53653 TaxID=457427 RepID=D9WEY2_9ACTN|nr:conserved hypothetical protein [Streptomyces himastatinicus ATCC 53653]